MYVKTTTPQANHSSVSYHAERPQNTAPVILESFVEDDGETVMHILSNGNTISEDNYKKFWEPKRTAILPKNYKGQSPDKTQIPR